MFLKGTDLNSNGITIDLLPFLNLKYLSSDTVNSFTTSHFSSLTTSQIMTLLNSYYYPQYSANSKAQLNSLASTGETTTSNADKSSKNMISIIIPIIIGIYLTF